MKRIIPILFTHPYARLGWWTGALVCLCHVLFYAFAEEIWSVWIPPRPETLTPTIAYGITGLYTSQTEPDGIEAFVLHGILWLIVGWGFLQTTYFNKWPVWPAIGLCLLILVRAGFHMPADGFLFGSGVKFYPVSITALTAFMLLVYAAARRYKPWQVGLWLGLLAIPCFVAGAAPSEWDYSFIFAPAYAWISGASLPDIYFQYDLLLSAIAALWMKSGLDLSRFQHLGQASLWLFSTGVFWLGKGLFKETQLALYLLIVAFIMRVFPYYTDAYAEFQMSPLRLDWWLPVILVAWKKGTQHWAVGLLLAVLVCVHRSFGIFFSIAYVEYIAFLILTEWAERQFNVTVLKEIVRKAMQTYALSISLILVGFLTTYLIFGNILPTGMRIYQSLKIGFMRVHETSFFWYVAGILGLTTATLWSCRARLSATYFHTALLLIILTISNLLYFLGRSHEHNLPNSSGPVVVVLFIWMDLLWRASEHKPSDNPVFRMIRFLPLAVIWFVGIAYTVGIKDKVRGMAINLRQGHLIYPFIRPTEQRLQQIRLLTNHSPKVYFYDKSLGKDFWYTFDGGYQPVGYFQPYSAWALMPDLLSFLQNLLDQGYYLVTETSTEADAILPHLHFRTKVTKDGFIVVSN
ncbi:hypothetical protein [Siphonobacter sp. SORGH_AS_1065]|uniref:hypothetical protein n=1 Tax=Siphonobacter sp. SORGH_AS_1065 TaxID=3041795 RepID=UPI00278AA18B|nr:hypothetical protein [Siphonobacter sp. SORGH_AS_1065]MDQ1087999.1 hypothetical protein [Siphonobacter sp. SORGH_AS_1065]